MSQVRKKSSYNLQRSRDEYTYIEDKRNWSVACSEKIIFYICSAGAIWQINMEVYSRDLHLKI